MSKWFKVFGWICLGLGVIGSLITLVDITNANMQIVDYNSHMEGLDIPMKETISRWYAWIPLLALAFQSAFFFAIGEALKHLKKTAEETTSIRKALIQTNENETKDAV